MPAPGPLNLNLTEAPNSLRSYYYAHQPESEKGFPAEAVVRKECPSRFFKAIAYIPIFGNSHIPASSHSSRRRSSTTSAIATDCYATVTGTATATAPSPAAPAPTPTPPPPRTTANTTAISQDAL